VALKATFKKSKRNRAQVLNVFRSVNFISFFLTDLYFDSIHSDSSPWPSKGSPIFETINETLNPSEPRIREAQKPN
jgi:hypothetical protein